MALLTEGPVNVPSVVGQVDRLAFGGQGEVLGSVVHAFVELVGQVHAGGREGGPLSGRQALSLDLYCSKEGDHAAGVA